MTNKQDDLPPHSGQNRPRRARRARRVLRVLPAQRAIQRDQDRPRQPADRPARRLRRGRRLHPRRRCAASCSKAARERRQDLQGRDHLQGQPVERQPRRRSRLRPDPRRQGRPDLVASARPTPPTRCPTRPRSTRCPASPPTARGSRISSAARATRRRASTGPIISSGAWRTSSPPSWRCGTSVPTNKVVGGLFPNDADGNAWGDPKLGLPPALAKAGYKLHRSGPLPAA